MSQLQNFPYQQRRHSNILYNIFDDLIFHFLQRVAVSNELWTLIPSSLHRKEPN